MTLAIINRINIPIYGNYNLEITITNFYRKLKVSRHIFVICDFQNSATLIILEYLWLRDVSFIINFGAGIQ